MIYLRGKKASSNTSQGQPWPFLTYKYAAVGIYRSAGATGEGGELLMDVGADKALQISRICESEG